MGCFVENIFIKGDTMKTNTSKTPVLVLAKITLLIGLGVLLVFSVFAFVNWGDYQDVALLLDKTGEVFYVATNETSLQSVDKKTSLYPGYQLVSGLEGGAMVSLFDQGVVVELYPNTSLTFNEIGEKGGQKYAEINLIQGEVKISTTEGVLGVQTSYGLAAVGGDSSVMAVTTNNIADESLVLCQSGSCAFQQNGETNALAMGELVTLQQANAPLVKDVEDSVARLFVEELFPQQALIYPDSHPLELVVSIQADQTAELDSEAEAVILQVLEENSETEENEEVQMPSQQAESVNPLLSDVARSERSALSDAASALWQLDSYGTSFNQSGVIPGTKITLNYDLSAGEVFGFSGCNEYRANLIDNNGDLSVKTIQTTKTRCDRTVSNQEKTYLNLLRKVNGSALFGDNSLTLYTSNGEALVFTPGDSTSSTVYTRATPMPTSTSAPTATPLPTSTKAPTATPLPTSTPAPTSAVTDAFYVSTNGNDSNPGTNEKPWKTIAKAANTLSSGQTAIVLAGTYAERVEIRRDGITLKANGKVQMKGFEINGDNNTVIGFTISDKSSHAGIYVKGNNNLVQGNEIFHMRQDGIWFFGSGNVYRNNYIHDILDPAIDGDPHADCFQTWAQYGPVTNTVMAGNTCIHNRTSGSNQIFMVEAQNAKVDNLVVRDNTFVMYDTGETLLNINRKDGQYPITNIKIINNSFENVTGTGLHAVRFRRVDGGQVTGNTVIGYDGVYRNNESTNILVENNDLQ